jgi:hypothetical protein
MDSPVSHLGARKPISFLVCYRHFEVSTGNCGLRENAQPNGKAEQEREYRRPHNASVASSA